MMRLDSQAHGKTSPRLVPRFNSSRAPRVKKRASCGANNEDTLAG